MRTTEPEWTDRAPRDWGVYLYCFAQRSVAGRIESPGIADCESDAVTTLTAAEVAALYSPVHLDAFRGPAGDAHLRDMSWLLPRACQHEQVVEEVMRLSPVLPARFGTVLSSAGVLEGVMARNVEQIRLFLERVAGREEWSVKAFLDLPQAEAWLLAAQTTCDEPSGTSTLSPGRRYIQGQQRRAQARRGLQNYGRQMAEDITQALALGAVEMRPLELPPRQTAGHTGQMILNCALLVPKASVDEWRAAVDTLGAQYVDHGVSLGISGPWPPYSFCPSVLDAEPLG